MEERTRVPEGATTPAKVAQHASRQALAECRRAVRASQRSVTILDALAKGRAERDASRANGVNRRVREDAVERVARLRPRELEVLVLYCLGLRTEDVASALFVSHHTVRTHVKNALSRLEVHARPDAVVLVRHASGSADVSLAALRILPELERWGKNSRALTSALEMLASGRAG